MKKIAVIGLGYVGLPLAIEFSKKYKVIGFDISKDRIENLKLCIDKTYETTKEDILESIKNGILFTNKMEDIFSANIFIVTVPTPITKSKKPNLSFLRSASEMIAKGLKVGDIVIYESTVYPGCTEEFCVPILEKKSKLKLNVDFFCGYSPERINPGDKERTLTKIKKVVSGSNEHVANEIKKLYESIIDAGIYMAESIKVAEASKAIENAQRDLNISFVNELSLIFDKMDIDTNEVLNAASTKWNFLNFKPGLVGGHCISVDPYYLTYKSEKLGYIPEVILSGRKVNDNMPFFIASKLIKTLISRKIKFLNSKVLILGISFKENCPDIRNSKIPIILDELESYGISVSIFDPIVDKDEVEEEFSIKLIDNLGKYDGVILAVSHDVFKDIDIDKLKKNDMSVVFDLKGILDKKEVDFRL